MKYKPRPGIVKTKLCDQYVLIPTRAAFSECNSILPLPKLWAATWDAIATDYPLEKSVKFHMILTRKPEEEVRKSIDDFCKALCRNGFLIEVPETDAPDGSTDPEESQGSKPTDEER